MAQKKQMTIEKLMENLRDEILREVGEKDCSISVFAGLCGVSQECLYGILYKRSKSVDCNTIIKICENSGISYTSLFEIKDVEIFDRLLRNFEFTNGDVSYKICKAK